jgi:hypothetical protein
MRNTKRYGWNLSLLAAMLLLALLTVLPVTAQAADTKTKASTSSVGDGRPAKR